MQPDLLPIFISRKNKYAWIRKHWGLARRDEVLHNIALQSEMPPLPWPKPIPVLRVYTDCIGSGGTLVGMFVLGLAMWWFVSAACDYWRDINTLTMMGCALGLSLLVLVPVFSLARRYRGLLVYPPCVVQLYQQLGTSGNITTCEVHNVEAHDDSTYLIHYQFTLLQSGESVRGHYITNKPLQAGMKMAVIYLDTTCHVLL